ncbi:DUF6497 family protein [Wenxinia saemankumensis]|uniref:Acetolactate synthase n=1 Tax=Wenxinia saemankumensis TaxID=1447782 RepID=A0A1M6AQS0_9RHOB|nr:DUF6497 family protein [Wenxinia saemankumensis]SHI38747.1 hypothetical protein SAMN05444417_0568 [Wenxinia saemankumensis]
MRAAIILALLAAPLAAPAQEIDAPSGLHLVLQDVIWEAETATVRLRFVAPALGGTGEDGAPMAFSEVSGDFQWLCDVHGVPAIVANDLAARQVVISIADREIPFGQMDPDAVQFFEGYSIAADGTCQWEPY